MVAEGARDVAVEGEAVNYRTAKAGGFSLDYDMANFKFTKIRDARNTPREGLDRLKFYKIALEGIGA